MEGRVSQWKRNLILMSGVSAIAVSLALPGSMAMAASSTSGTTITFWNGFTGPDATLLKKIVDNFNRTNSDHVTVQMNIMPWDVLGQKLPTAIATNTAPTFAALIASTSTSYVSNGTLQDLSDFFNVKGIKKSSFTPASLSLGQIAGHQYLLPMQTNGLYLYWNKALFKQAGLNPNRPPKNLNQMAQYAKKLTVASKQQYGLGLPTTAATPYYVSFIQGNGGDVVNMKTKKSELDSPQNVSTFAWIRQLVFNDKVSPANASNSNLENLMQSGKLGMFIDGPWLVPGLESNHIKFGVSIPPRGRVAQSVVFDGIGFAIPSETNQAQKQAVYAFIKYWDSPAVSKEWSLANGFPPYIKSVIKDPQVKKNYVVSSMAKMGNAAHTFLAGLNSAGQVEGDIINLISEMESGAGPAASVKATSQKIDQDLQADR